MRIIRTGGQNTRPPVSSDVTCIRSITPINGNGTYGSNTSRGVGDTKNPGGTRRP